MDQATEPLLSPDPIEALIARLRNYDYEMGETRTHILGMWQAMQDAADAIEELHYALACIANPDWKDMSPEQARVEAHNALAITRVMVLGGQGND